MANAIDVAQRAIKAYNDRDVKAIAELLSEAPEYSRGAQVARSKEQVLAVYRLDWEDFPDARTDIKLAIAEGSVVALECVWTGTNTGPLHLPDGTTAPATGRQVILPCVTVLEVKNGLVVTVRNYWDNMVVMEQLGLLPAPAA